MNSLEKLNLAANLKEAAATFLEDAVGADDFEQEVFDYLVQSGKVKTWKWKVDGYWYTTPTWKTKSAVFEDKAILAMMRSLRRREVFTIKRRHGIAMEISLYESDTSATLYLKLLFGSKENLRKAIQFYGLQLDWTQGRDYFQRAQDTAGREYAQAERLYSDAGKKLNDLNAFISDLEST